MPAVHPAQIFPVYEHVANREETYLKLLDEVASLKAKLEALENEKLLLVYDNAKLQDDARDQVGYGVAQWGGNGDGVHPVLSGSFVCEGVGPQ
jgi:hypothetical protein